MEITRRTFIGGLGTAAAAGGLPYLEDAIGMATDPAPRFFVASLTPLDRRLQFDEALARDLMAYFGEKGVDGVLVMGTTGEFSSFSLTERKKVLETMVRHKGRLETMCHIGTPNLPETLELLEHASGAGVDKVLILPPYYFKNPPVDGLYSFFSPILDRSRIPVLLYHIPQISGVPIPHELLQRLQSHERLYGIKDSSGKPDDLTAYITRFPRLRILTGSPRLIGMALKNGGGGAVTGNGNVLPAETAAVFRDFRAGRDTEAAQTRLDECSRRIPSDMPAMKFLLGELGLRESYCRPPLVEPSAERKAELRSRLAELKNI